MPYRTKYTTVVYNQINKNIDYFKALKYPLIPFSSSDLYAISTIGDRLDSLAHQFYQDVDLWWVIATANPDIIRRDSLVLKPGIEFRIPQEIESIIVDFKNINS